jgi:hypothetical protein
MEKIWWLRIPQALAMWCEEGKPMDQHQPHWQKQRRN